MKLLEQTKIDTDHMSVDLINQASLYAEYVEKHSASLRKSAAAKRSLDLLAAELDATVRDEYAAKGEKITEAKIGNEILRKPVYQTALKDYDEAHAEYVLSQNSLECLRQKRDMLIQLSK